MLTLRLLSLLSVLLVLPGCVALMDATSDTTIEPDPGKRTFGAYLDDERLETIIAVNLRKTGPGIAEAHVNAICFNGVVLLTGEVPSKELKEYAGETVRAMAKVRQVHNRLLIKSNSTLFSRTNDNWIATKVRSQLITNDSLESERVKVVVENRIVYLMGLLTHSEAQIVSEIAAATSGVEQVVRVIEYIER